MILFNKSVLFRFIVLGQGPSVSKSSTLPLPHRISVDRPASSMAGRERDRERERDRDGYYSDRNELIRDREREKERERERERGYLSDHNSRYVNNKISKSFYILQYSHRAIKFFSWKLASNWNSRIVIKSFKIPVSIDYLKFLRINHIGWKFVENGHGRAV